ncbi:MAG: phage antirepressor KilAC domain-containing protein [Bacteroidaceae bacterium]|nr:phage antirepressor KilAC domain-containing protein [Bacteroidaceae bacterium]
MNGIQIFRNQEFGAIRTMSNEQGEVMFCAKDVCNALGYSKARNAVAQHVDDDDALKQGLIDSMGRKQRATFINESGLYALILSSKLDSAKRFKHWVTSEVLPAIRKQGGYMVARPDESDEVIMARALQIMQTTLQRRDEQIAKLKPRADYADHVLDSISCFTVTQIGKELNMTGHDLNMLLCRMGIQYPQSGQYLLYANYARQGLAKNRNFEYHSADGELKTKTYLVWTERGSNFIHQLVGSPQIAQINTDVLN